MDIERYLVVFYVLFWIARIYGCFRRGRQPLLRGPEWFFNVPVPADFYKGAGRTLLYRYWMRLILPLALDVPIAAAMFYTNHILWLRYLIFGECVLIHLNHVHAVDVAERRARTLFDTAQEPVVRVSVSLEPRRLRDYSNAKIEWALALTTLFVFAWLARDAMSAGWHDLRYVFAVPLLMLYLQMGLLFVKQLAVAWRMPVPQSQIDEHTEMREQTRRHYLQLCVWGCVTITMCMLLWPVKLSLPVAMRGRLVTIWLTTWFAIAIGTQVWL